jgi:hypothetical protein
MLTTAGLAFSTKSAKSGANTLAGCATEAGINASWPKLKAVNTAKKVFFILCAALWALKGVDD